MGRCFGYDVTVPEVAGRITVGGMRLDPSFFALLVALVVYTASHIAEIVRGSIQAVHRGQDEAAQALALSGFQRMWFVVLPQAFRIALPPLGNQYLNLHQELVARRGDQLLRADQRHPDLGRQQLAAGAGLHPHAASSTSCISLVVSGLVNLWNRRLALVTR